MQTKAEEHNLLFNFLKRADKQLRMCHVYVIKLYIHGLHAAIILHCNSIAIENNNKKKNKNSQQLVMFSFICGCYF